MSNKREEGEAGSKGIKPARDVVGAIVYAVLLKPFGKLPESWQRELEASHPGARRKAAVIYVGQTRLPAEERFSNHLEGYKASAKVRRYQQQLIVLDRWRPELPFAASPRLVKEVYLLARRSRVNPAQREAAVAELFRRAGFYVYSS